MIIGIKEQLFLTEEERQILQRANELVSEIFYNSVEDRELEKLASDAQDCISELLEMSSLE